jgi:hypothetical protein
MTILFEEARETLDNVFVNFMPEAVTWFEALEELWEEYPEELLALVQGWDDET